MVGHPIERDFTAMVCANYIRNCPATTSDITGAHKVFGPNITALRGQKVQKAPKLVKVDYVQVPRQIRYVVKNITLCAGVMFVNGLGFLVSV